MKPNKPFFAFVALFFLTLFVGCSSNPSEDALSRWMGGEGKIKVLSTIGMIDDLVGLIGGDRVAHIALIQGDIDPHSYELLKGDDEKFSSSDLIFYNGLGLEHGASLSYKLKTNPKASSLGDLLHASRPEKVLEQEGVFDPHIWMDVSLWKEVAAEIVRILSDRDPRGRAEFVKRGEALIDEMSRCHEEIVALFQSIPNERKYLVTSHDAFAYFVRAYMANDEERVSGRWKERSAAPEGLAPDGQLGSRHLQQVIDFLTTHHVASLFPESNVSPVALKKIIASCLAVGHQVKLSQETLYGDAMGEKGSDGDTYLKMVRHNARIIAQELK